MFYYSSFPLFPSLFRGRCNRTFRSPSSSRYSNVKLSTPPLDELFSICQSRLDSLIHLTSLFSTSVIIVVRKRPEFGLCYWLDSLFVFNFRDGLSCRCSDTFSKEILKALHDYCNLIEIKLCGLFYWWYSRELDETSFNG